MTLSADKSKAQISHQSSYLQVGEAPANALPLIGAKVQVSCQHIGFFL